MNDYGVCKAAPGKANGYNKHFTMFLKTRG